MPLEGYSVAFERDVCQYGGEAQGRGLRLGGYKPASPHRQRTFVLCPLSFVLRPSSTHLARVPRPRTSSTHLVLAIRPRTQQHRRAPGIFHSRAAFPPPQEDDSSVSSSLSCSVATSARWQIVPHTRSRSAGDSGARPSRLKGSYCVVTLLESVSASRMAVSRPARLALSWEGERSSGVPLPNVAAWSAKTVRVAFCTPIGHRRWCDSTMEPGVCRLSELPEARRGHGGGLGRSRRGPPAAQGHRGQHVETGKDGSHGTWVTESLATRPERSRHHARKMRVREE
ncbi:hypothetical protein B0T24DRAFT_123288 [Lasiosphaeria ovina]|uniref:Uncharacterized protein n=1 Tax=Lasiosphaeria ovina TaxID=92902 RepID=A0AAE0JSR3_9PEZI|nr:hypothetical protein B0T24DRAFT_123288 [Lasiosphaeria ovina]